jgi:hypothetical protein
MMKYFFCADDFWVYSVPKKYWHLLDIINDPKVDDFDVIIAAHEIVRLCKRKIRIEALTQTL